MQPRVLVLASVNQLQQARKAGLADHARERRLVEIAIEQQQADDGVQGPQLVLLQQTVDDLGADVLLVRLEEGAGEEHPRAGRNVILRLAGPIAERGC